EALHRILDTLDTPCSPKERPMVLQLGGSNPKDLAEAVRIARPWGFDEINLNCGCPSPKVAQVQDGLGFGAQLMKNPELVRQCTQAMCEQAAPGIEVSVKCRIGTHRSLDDMERDGDNLETLLDFIDTVSQSGVKRFAVHARSGILSGLNPDKNRKVPPLRRATSFPLRSMVVFAASRKRISTTVKVWRSWLGDGRSSHLGHWQTLMLASSGVVICKPLLHLFNGIPGSNVARLAVRGSSGGGPEGQHFGRNWAAGLLPSMDEPMRPRRPRQQGHLPNRLLGALALLRDPRELDGEGLGKAATAAAREGLDDPLWWDAFTARTKELLA
ncbi:unnamed protein product, partial [Polarella glacialis]